MKLKIFPLLCILVVQGFSQLPKHGVTDVYAYHYLALSCLSLDHTVGSHCQPYEIQRPEAGVTVQIFITFRDGTGWHTSAPHTATITDNPIRPPAVEFQPGYPQVCVTGADGYCNWFVRNSGFSGEYDVIMIPQDKVDAATGTVLHFPLYQDRFYAGVTIDDKNGNPHTFDPLVAAPYASGTYPDVRHLDSNGQAIYNRFGETAFVKNLQKAAFNYFSSVYSAGRYRMAPRFISIPDGGVYDAEVDVNGQYLFDPWISRKGMANMWGIAAVVVHPGQFVDPSLGSQERINQFLALRKIMRQAGIRLSKVKPTGEKIGLGSEAEVAAYWGGQIMLRYVALGPILPDPGQQ